MAGRPTKAEALVFMRRREEVARLYCQGLTQREIGERLGIDHSNVCRDLEVVRRLWLESALVNFDERKAEEIARLNNLERICLEAWERSCRHKTKQRVKREPVEVLDPDEDTVTERPDPPKEVVTERVTEREQLLGDPRFITEARQIVDQRCKLLGLYPKEKEPPAPATPNVNVSVGVGIKFDLTRLSDDQLRQYEAIIQVAGAAAGGEEPPGAGTLPPAAGAVHRPALPDSDGAG